MQRIGIVDLGSNTARLAVFLTEPGAWYRLIDGIREPVRLGEGLAAAGALSPAAIERAAAALRLFSDYARATDLDAVEVFGTSALRDASNAGEVVERAADLGLQVRVLDGEEEARLGVLAVANAFAARDAWILDLGGGSAQLSLMRDRRFVEGASHPLGAVRLTEEHLTSDPPRRRQVRSLEAAVERSLGGLVDRLADPALPLIAIGGTVRNLARASQEFRDDPLGLLHGYAFEREALEGLTRELARRDAAGRAEIPGLNPDRADIILAGALVFRWLLRRTGRDRIVVSGHGVREGAFFRRFLPRPHLLADVRRFSVANLMAQYHQDVPHVERVVRLAVALFDDLRPLHGLSDGDRALLEAAAYLHDIGMAIDYHRHHKHGAYLVHSAALGGFSQREQALIAQMIRFHRKGTPRLGSLARLCRKGDRRRLLQLSTCLRLAEHLERSRAGRVTAIRTVIRDDEVAIEVTAREHPTVEIWETAKQGDLFESAFGARMRVVAGR